MPHRCGASIISDGMVVMKSCSLLNKRGDVFSALLKRMGIKVKNGDPLCMFSLTFSCGPVYYIVKVHIWHEKVESPL